MPEISTVIAGLCGLVSVYFGACEERFDKAAWFAAIAAYVNGQVFMPIQVCEQCGFKFTYKASPCEKRCPNCGHQHDCDAT